MLSSILQDLRFGLLMLRRSPGVALTAAFMLALGIGANTTIFSVVNAVLFRPLHFQSPNRLMVLREQSMKRGDWRNPALGTSLDWRKHAHSFEQIEFAVTYYETANIIRYCWRSSR
jgi:hypothetical protein